MVQQNSVRKPVLGLLVTALLGGCGFAPMYGTHAPAASSATAPEAALAQVEIANIPDHNGVMLRNALIDRFYSGGYPANPAYTLSIADLKEATRELDLTKSSEATRGQLNLTATLRLYNRSNPGTPVLERRLASINSYNILESEFATRVTRDSARESGLRDLARQAEMNLVMHFNRSKDTSR